MHDVPHPNRMPILTKSFHSINVKNAHILVAIDNYRWTKLFTSNIDEVTESYIWSLCIF